MAIVREQKIPIFETPYRCIRAVNALVKYNEFRENWLKARKAEQSLGAAKPTQKPADVFFSDLLGCLIGRRAGGRPPRAH